ncbi:MAG: hypothetical protein LBB42_05565 [Coriobacteriales bacterium]|jgi:hypothetical protein|nr:hypothetical protein [Coriobacteriales bacterium]
MQEFRRVIGNGKYALVFILLVILSAALLYQEQSENNLSIDAFEYGKIYQKVHNEIEGDNLYQIEKQLNEKQKKCDDMFAALEVFYVQNKSFDTFFDEHPNLSHDFDKAEYEYVLAREHVVKKLLTQVKDLQDYPAYLLQIQEEKERMQKFSFLQKGGAFSTRNLERTAQDFYPLIGAEVQFGSDQAVTAFTQYKILDFIVLIILLIYCLKFSEDRRKGLRELFSSLPRGRYWLAACRVFILFVISFAITVFIYGGALVECFVLYGGAQDLGRPIQSISIFQSSALQASISQYLAYFFIFRFFATFLLSLIVWGVLRSFSEIKYSVLLLAVIIGVEYALYTFISTQSYLNILKYLNLFSLIHADSIFVGYFNLNIFGYPLGVRLTIIVLLLPCLALLAAACLYEQKAVHSKLLIRSRWFSHIATLLVSNFRLFLFELYKLLIIQKGLLVFCVLLVALLSFQFYSYIPLDDIERQENAYFVELEGEINQKTFSDIALLQRKIDEQKEAFSQIESEYFNGQVSYADYYQQERAFHRALTQEIALERVQKRALDLQESEEVRFASPWLISEHGYKSIYGFMTSDGQDRESFVKQQLVGSFILLALCLLLAGSYSYERQSGSNKLLSTTARGRLRIRINKLGASILITFFVWFCMVGKELYELFQLVPLSSLHAPIQSFSLFAHFPVPATILQFLIFACAMRLVNLACIACVIMLISALCKNVMQTTIISIILLVFPSTLFAFSGADVFKYFALSKPVMVVGSLMSSSGALQGCVIMSSLLLCGAIFSLFLIGKLQGNRR